MRVDRLIASTDALGYETTYQYDNQNNLIIQKSPLHQITWHYDLENRPLSENTSGLEKKFCYDKLGRTTSSTDPSGHTTLFAYDPLGRLIRTQHPDGGIEHKQYDILGNVIQETDPNGHITQKKYNIRNQPTHIIYPDGTEETFRYDTRGNLVQHTKNGCITQYTYDLMGHLIHEEASYEGQKLHSKKATYSPFSKLSETDENGVATYFTYDSAGRLIAEQKENLRINYAYDPLGRLTHTQKPFTTYIQEYDYLGQLLEKRTEDSLGGVTFQESYLYDAAGNQTHTITCCGTSITTYNPQQLPIESTDPCGNTTAYTYHYAPHFSKIAQDPDGICKIETQDSCGRLKSIQVLNVQGKPILSREFKYDLSGNRIQDLEHIYHGTTYTQTVETNFEYGPRGRIERMVEANLKETRYLYDGEGRLCTIIKPDLTEIHHTYDP